MRRSSPPASSAARLRLADPLERPPSEEVERRSATASAAEPACAGLDTAQGRRPRAAIISAIPRLSLGYPSAFPRLSLGYASAPSRLHLASIISDASSAVSNESSPADEGGADEAGGVGDATDRLTADGAGEAGAGEAGAGSPSEVRASEVPDWIWRSRARSRSLIWRKTSSSVVHVTPTRGHALAGPRPWLALGLPPAREPRSARLAEVGHTERYISAVPRPHLGCISARSRRGRPRRATSETPTASSERGPTSLFGDSSVTPSETPRRRRRRRAAAAARRRAAGTRPSPRRAKIAPRRLPPS